jgi:hypothetical protein
MHSVIAKLFAIRAFDCLCQAKMSRPRGSGTGRPSYRAVSIHSRITSATFEFVRGPWSVVCRSATGSISGGQFAWRMVCISAHGAHERA